MTILINGLPHECQAGERIIEVLNRSDVGLSQVCYHPQLGPIQTCDTCFVEANGGLVRACATAVSGDMTVSTIAPAAQAARTEAFDRILSNHFLYCTVCDNNNGNCVDNTNPFYRYDPNQCILCGRCVEACQNLQVNETLSIRWEMPILACFGMAVPQLGNPAAFHVGIA